MVASLPIWRVLIVCVCWYEAVQFDGRFYIVFDIPVNDCITAHCDCDEKKRCLVETTIMLANTSLVDVKIVEKKKANCLLTLQNEHNVCQLSPIAVDSIEFFLSMWINVPAVRFPGYLLDWIILDERIWSSCFNTHTHTHIAVWSVHDGDTHLSMDRISEYI